MNAFQVGIAWRFIDEGRAQPRDDVDGLPIRLLRMREVAVLFIY